MNDEIKEILNGLNVVIKHNGSVEINSKECKKIIDYITNLQNKNKKISEQHIYTLDKLIETQTRIEKTIEYIKENGYIDLNGYDLLKITGGDE